MRYFLAATAIGAYLCTSVLAQGSTCFDNGDCIGKVCACNVITDYTLLIFRVREAIVSRRKGKSLGKHLMKNMQQDPVLIYTEVLAAPEVAHPRQRLNLEHPLEKLVMIITIASAW